MSIKRKELTTDDLLRQTEGPARKKYRVAESSRIIGRNDWEAPGSSDIGSEEEDSGLGEELNDDGSREEGSDNNSQESSGESEEDLEQQPSSHAADSFPGNRFVSRGRVGDDGDRQFATTNAQVPTFASFGIAAPLLAALISMSIKMPTPVQAACIPPLLQGKDCIGNAKTGSGKTIAFALPILQQLSVDPYGVYALILTPTRELAFQISEQFAVLGGALNVRTAVIVGGMDMMTQALELAKRPHVIVATPGRIVDHLKSNNGEWSLSRVRFLVLDEADRLLTSTFTPELTYLFNVLPKDRQTCLFTATWTPSIESLSNAQPRPGKQKPFVHRMSELVETVSSLKQSYILVPSHVREVYLFHLLSNPPESTLHLRRAPPEPTKSLKQQQKAKAKKKKDQSKSTGELMEQPPPTIIFCHRPRTAAYLTNLLKTLSIRATPLHSRLTQRERLSSLQLFKSSIVPVLVSTDVGARGLDIEDVAMVVNWDLPNEPEEYTHRVGRTARAGRGGVAISFVTEMDEERVLRIEQRINTKLEEMDLPESKVLEKLNSVSTAKRLANMELHDSDFGKREEIHKQKQLKARLASSQ